MPATGDEPDHDEKTATTTNVPSVPVVNGDKKEPPAANCEEKNDEENGSHAEDGENNEGEEQEKEVPRVLKV